MGLLSFLFGGKKDKPKPAKPASVAEAIVAPPAPARATAATPTSVEQARLRLKLAASLRSGHHVAACEAARRLADIQIRAGRKNVARIWREQADRISREAGLSA